MANGMVVLLWLFFLILSPYIFLYRCIPIVAVNIEKRVVCVRVGNLYIFEKFRFLVYEYIRTISSFFGAKLPPRLGRGALAAGALQRRVH